MSAISFALEGLTRAEARVNTAAAQIATLGQPQGDSVDLSQEFVNLIQARNLSEISVKVAQTADQLDQTLLNVLG